MKNLQQIEQVKALLNANVPIIWTTSPEEGRFLQEVYLNQDLSKSKTVWFWSATSGLVDSFAEMLEGKRCYGKLDGTLQINAAIDKIVAYKEEKNLIVVMRDMHIVLQDQTARRLRDIYDFLANTGKSLLIVSPFLSHVGGNGIHPLLEKQVVVVDYSLPSREQIIELAKQRLEEYYCNSENKTPNYDDEHWRSIGKSLQGLSSYEIENSLATSLVNTSELKPEILMQEKKQLIKKNNILEYVDTTVSENDIGGLDLAKEYLIKYKDANSKEAEEFGVEPLRGIILVGPPGAGKSLFAKSLGNLWGLPLVRLDIGKVMGRLVGDSIRGNEEVVYYDSKGNSFRKIIKELVEEKPDDCWVPTYTNEGKFLFKKVTDFIKHRITDRTKLYEIELEGKRKIVITQDHCVFTHDDKLNLISTEIGNLKVGDSIAAPLKLAAFPGSQEKGTFNQGFLAGAWLGDGDYNGRDTRYHLNNKDIESFSAIFEQENLNYSIYNSSSSNEAKVVYVRNNLQEKMKNQGFIGDSYTKRIPEMVFGMSLDYIKGLICGYFSTDGSFSGHVLECSSASYELSKDIINLLAFIGIYGFLGEKQVDNSKEKIIHSDLEYHTRIQISGRKDLEIFRDEIGFAQDYKNQVLEECIKLNENNLQHGIYIPQTETIKNEIKLLRSAS